MPARAALLRPAAAYAFAVFSAGFALGTLRVLVLAPRLGVKWSGKTGQSAKVYPTHENGYANDDGTPIFG